MGNLISSCVDYCISFLVAKANYILELEDNLDALQSDVQRLKARRIDLENRIKIEERKGLQRLQEVGVWLLGVKAIQPQVRDLLAARTVEIERLSMYGYCSNNFILTYRYGKKVSENLEKVKGFLSSSKAFKVVTWEGLNVSVPKPGTEVKLVAAISCRIAFERGKERTFSFLALSSGVSGWIVLAEESPSKPDFGIVRVTAPLAGCEPRIDEKHPRWLHLTIRPSTLPLLDPTKRGVQEKLNSKGLVNGRWTLGFRDVESCYFAYSMVEHEMELQCSEVEIRL